MSGLAEFMAQPVVVTIVAWVALALSVTMWLNWPRGDRPWPGDDDEPGHIHRKRG